MGHPQGNMRTVAARLGCQSNRVGQFLPWLHGQARKALLSSCKGGKGCLGSEQVFDN